MEARTILLEAVLNPDDSIPPTISMANLFIEFSYWIKDTGPYNVQEAGEIGLPSGMMKWRAKE
jgi:hypothetical protein